MPTYDLRCEECGHRFELFLLRLLRNADKVCPTCGSSRVVTGVGGGYVTAAAVTPGSCGSSSEFS